MESYEDYLKRSREEYITMFDPSFHYHLENLKRTRRICAELMNPQLDDEGKRKLFSELFGYNLPESVEILPPFNCDVGTNILMTRDVFINYGCAIVDIGIVKFGTNVMLGPGVKIIAVDHPRKSQNRVNHETIGRDVTIGNDVWIGANAVIMPGITIGDDVIVGAGAVVTKDVPSGTTVVGVPARPIEKKGQ